MKQRPQGMWAFWIGGGALLLFVLLLTKGVWSPPPAPEGPGAAPLSTPTMAPPALYPTDTPLPATELPPTATPTLPPLPTTVLSVGDHPRQVLNGDAVRQHPAGSILLWLPDLPLSFNWVSDPPQVRIGSGNTWDAFEYVGIVPLPDTGLMSLEVSILHTESPADAQSRVGPALQEAAEGDADGLHRPLRSPDALPGVHYQRLIAAPGGAWEAVYDAVFAEGRYVNKITALVGLDSAEDHLLGIDGLNYYVALIMQREQSTP